MSRPLVVAGLLGFFGVAFGAFGAHALRDWFAMLPDGDRRMGWWQTAVDYQMWHAPLLLALAWRKEAGVETSADVGAYLTLAGVFLFSGSLYAMALTGLTWFGAITPVGGLCLLGGWVALLFAARSPRRDGGATA